MSCIVAKQAANNKYKNPTDHTYAWEMETEINLD